MTPRLPHPEEDTAATERPILFSGPMVRAILDGRKTQTRRVFKHQPEEDRSRLVVGSYHPTIIVRGEEAPGAETFGAYSDDGDFALPCPYGVVGDRLWVRETHSIFDLRPESCDTEFSAYPTGPCPVAVGYFADDSSREITITPEQWREPFDCDHVIPRPSIHMPRWASRITLEITAIRVERIRDISAEDCRAEGVDGGDSTNELGWRYSFGSLWNSINEKRGYGWDANPWVWAISFRRVVSA